MNTSNDRSRTYWAPTIERYFTELMVQQISEGNRSGHTFNKHAWNEMVMTLNAKFGSQYDKDYLKGRYTNLWKQFNDVKNILSQGGFSWDETSEMVVADDWVWKTYVSANPEMRSYKNKAVLNFKDLCTIYEYTTADGRYSRSSHDIDMDNKVLGVNMGGGDSFPSSFGDRPLRTDWTFEMDKFFIELMLDQVGRRKKSDGAFNKQAWSDMLTLFNKKFGPQNSKRVLRHRYKKLWKYYNDMTKLLSQSGFCWNEAQHMIYADDGVWDAFIKVNPYARTYKMKVLPNYDDLVFIYGDAVHNGDSSLLLEHHEADVLEIKSGGGKRRRSSCGGNRRRTFWTPPMDSYFIDLLVQQVYNGNRLGQTFLTQAWIDMLTSFNAKFQSRHDKDVLKNRLKHLRRQYTDIKNLLKNREFSWDATRDMVAADDFVWNSYIRDHPESKSYRVKIVPSYEKLCLIFGEDSSDGGYNHLAQVVHEMPILMNGEGDNNYFPFTVEWTEPMDRCFIDLMLKQLERGTKIDHTFGQESCNQVIDSFNQKFQVQYTKYIFEDHYAVLLKDHANISDILNNTEFCWDEAQQRIIADNDVWEAYIKVHSFFRLSYLRYLSLDVEHQTSAVNMLRGVLSNKHRRKFNQIFSRMDLQDNPETIGYRYRHLVYYSDLRKLFGENVLGGRINDQDQEMKRDQRGLRSGLAPRRQRKHPSRIRLSDLEGCTKVQRSSKDVQKMVLQIARAFKMLVDKKRVKDTTESAIIALQAIPDIDDDDELLLDGCELLEDQKKAKTFLALDTTLRKKWLLRKLRPKGLRFLVDQL